MELKSGGQQSVPSIYANNSSVYFTPNDIVIELSMTGLAEGNRSLLNVNLSPGHAKVLSEVLRRNIFEFEKKIGKIPLPKEIEKEFGF